MKFSEEISQKLNRILETNLDAEKGYRFASENVEDPELQEFYLERAEERYDFAHELRAEIMNFGEVPKEGTTLLGDAQRAWINLKTLLSVNKAETILEEAVQGEQFAVAEYEEILSSRDIPENTAKILRKQKDAIVAVLNRVKSLELQA